MVSSCMMTPLMNSAAPGDVKSISRYVRRPSSVEWIPSVSNRLVKVGMVSSAARIPFPSATSVSATLSRSWLVMRILPVFVFLSHVSCDLESPFSLRHPRDRLDDRHAYVSRRAQWVVPFNTAPPRSTRFNKPQHEHGKSRTCVGVARRDGHANRCHNLARTYLKIAGRSRSAINIG